MKLKTIILLLITGIILLLIVHSAKANGCYTYENELGDVIETCGNTVTVYGKTPHNHEVLAQQKRQRVIKRLVEDEILRAHELKVEAAKIEVLGRLKQLGATHVNARAFGGRVENTTTSTNTVTNSNNS